MPLRATARANQMFR